MAFIRAAARDSSNVLITSDPAAGAWRATVTQICTLRRCAAGVEVKVTVAIIKNGERLPAVCARGGYHYTQCGPPNVWLINGFEYDETPYGKGVSIENMHALHHEIAHVLTEKKWAANGSGATVSAPGTRYVAEAAGRWLASETDRRWRAGRRKIACLTRSTF